MQKTLQSPCQEVAVSIILHHFCIPRVREKAPAAKSNLIFQTRGRHKEGPRCRGFSHLTHGGREQDGSRASGKGALVVSVLTTPSVMLTR